MKRTEEKGEPKQVIVFRKDLQVRKGKLAAQVAHASMKVFIDACLKETRFNSWEYRFYMKNDSAWEKWLNGRFTKIVVSCDSEQELDELYQKAIDNKLPCSMIIDAGLTEFNGVPTKTCIAIGPAYPDEIDEITSNLKLL